MSRIHRWAAPVVVLGLVAADPSHAMRSETLHLAYVDPGAGSFILQALVASIAGAAVAVSAYWRRIKRFLGLGSERDDTRREDSRSSDE